MYDGQWYSCCSFIFHEFRGKRKWYQIKILTETRQQKAGSNKSWKKKIIAQNDLMRWNFLKEWKFRNCQRPVFSILNYHRRRQKWEGKLNPTLKTFLTIFCRDLSIFANKLFIEQKCRMLERRFPSFNSMQILDCLMYWHMPHFERLIFSPYTLRALKNHSKL